MLNKSNIKTDPLSKGEFPLFFGLAIWELPL